MGWTSCWPPQSPVLPDEGGSSAERRNLRFSRDEEKAIGSVSHLQARTSSPFKNILVRNARLLQTRPVSSQLLEDLEMDPKPSFRATRKVRRCGMESVAIG